MIYKRLLEPTWRLVPDCRIRKRIYAHGYSASLLCCNRQIYLEAIAVFYGENTLRVRDHLTYGWRTEPPRPSTENYCDYTNFIVEQRQTRTRPHPLFENIGSVEILFMISPKRDSNGSLLCGSRGTADMSGRSMLECLENNNFGQCCRDFSQLPYLKRIKLGWLDEETMRTDWYALDHKAVIHLHKDATNSIKRQSRVTKITTDQWGTHFAPQVAETTLDLVRMSLADDSGMDEQ